MQQLPAKPDIAKKIAEHKPKNLTRKEKASTREHIKALASAHAEKAITKLSEILADRNSPASSKVAAASALLDRTCGKPKFQDEKETEATQLEKMSAPELVEYITQQVSGLPLPVRAVIAESAESALAFDAADLVEIDNQPAPTAADASPTLRSVDALPPLERAPKPKREPRR
jgi:hypothetical protein